MNKIVYYVATSLDGYIAGENDDISMFVSSGKGVEQYMEDLGTYESTIMGRKTYEFGYKYGLKPGYPAYTHMDHFIFSNELSFEDQHEQVHVCQMDMEKVKQIRASSSTDIYLCGGGEFAAWLLEGEQIDTLKLKVNPILLGKGVKLFGPSKKPYHLELTDSESYDDGLLINTYNIKY